MFSTTISCRWIWGIYRKPKKKINPISDYIGYICFLYIKLKEVFFGEWCYFLIICFAKNSSPHNDKVVCIAYMEKAYMI
jgi:hypothetical protein